MEKVLENKKMMEFLYVLEEIERCDAIEEQLYLSDEDELIRKAVNYAEELLITNGREDLRQIQILIENGFEVFPGEYDSFGWVIGCIKTKKGVITFG